MVVLAMEENVNGQPSPDAHAVKEVLECLPFDSPYTGVYEASFVYKVSPASAVKGYRGQRLVHGDDGMGKPPYTAPFPYGIPYRLPEEDTGVLDGMVRIDPEIAPGMAGEAETPVPGHALEHVIKEGDPGVDFRLTGGVHIQADPDAGLPGLPFLF
jgi:hypothetical protein